jgi:hypothetical protein
MEDVIDDIGEGMGNGENIYSEKHRPETHFTRDIYSHCFQLIR